MFLRRKKFGRLRRLREVIWPSAGWRRTLNYLFHRMARLPGSPYFIAAGFACGAAVSFTPMVGMHLALSCLLAWVMRASLMAAAVGTIVGNPWTFPFIWIWIYKFGHWILDIRAGRPAEHMDFLQWFGNLTEALLRFDVRYLFDTAGPVFLPMLVGSIPTAIAVWFVFYFSLKPAVTAYQHRRLARRIRKAQEERNASAAQTGG